MDINNSITVIIVNVFDRTVCFAVYANYCLQTMPSKKVGTLFIITLHIKLSMTSTLNHRSTTHLDPHRGSLESKNIRNMFIEISLKAVGPYHFYIYIGQLDTPMICIILYKSLDTHKKKNQSHDL
jgi:hypothetical protein